MSGKRFLVLGAGQGWHSDQLRQAGAQRGCRIDFGSYESLSARLNDSTELSCDAGRLNDYNAIMTRTMPAGTFEQVTFRLAILHAAESLGKTVVNRPRGLEIAIDKFATLAVVQRLGYAVPRTVVVQSREQAQQAFEQLGGDCVIKPIFGGEGKGVMRVRERELAWTVFSTLQTLGAAIYLQVFHPPGGCDLRMLVIGDDVFGIRRHNGHDFRANVSGGGTCARCELSEPQCDAARRIARAIGLQFAAVDMLECADGIERVIEVNAVPGWRGAQAALSTRIADRLINLLNVEVDATLESSGHG